jgi:hypothetical protein
MNKTEFEYRLLLYGSGLDRWPPDEAQAAHLLLDQDASARALLTEARALDVALTKATAPEAAGSALTGQVLAHVRRANVRRADVMRHRPWRALARLSPWRLAGAGAAAVTGAAAAGFAIGVFMAGVSPVTTDTMLMSIAGADAGVWLLQ